MAAHEPYTEPLPALLSDEIRDGAANGLREAGSNKALARSLGMDPADTSRLRTGHPAKRSVAAQASELVWRLGINYPRTTPYPLIVHNLILARKALMLGADTDVLVRRYADLEAKEMDLEVEKLRLLRSHADRLDVAHVRERLAAAQTELAALAQEIATREASS